MDNLLDIIKLVFLLKIPTAMGIDSITAWNLLRFSMAALFSLVLLPYVIITRRINGFVLIFIVASVAFFFFVRTPIPEVLVILFAGFSLLYIFDGFLVGSATVRLVRTQPKGLAFIFVGMLLLLTIMYFIPSQIGTIVYLIIISTLMVWELYSGMGSGSRIFDALTAVFTAVFITAIISLKTDDLHPAV